jgi:hypothetical protein
MSALVTSTIALLTALLPAIGNDSALVAQVIVWLVNVLPALVKEATDILPEIKNIISILSQSSAITPDQITQLQALDAQCDAAFEAAAQAAGAPPDVSDPPLPAA